jgi:tetratricopeptide (TPR) repeat protein
VFRRVTKFSSLAVLASLLALTVGVFGPSVTGTFVSDDTNAIVNNELVTGPLRPWAIFANPSWWGQLRADAPGYRPLVTLSFALNHAVSTGGAMGYHFVNLLLHAVVSWLVFVLGLRLGSSRRGAWLAAVVFCLLPIHTEAVAWIVGRAELMAAGCFAGATILLIDYRQRGAWDRLAGAAILFLGGLLSKENVVTLLAVPALITLLMPTQPHQRRRDGIALATLAGALCAFVAIRAGVGLLLSAAPPNQLDNPLSVLMLGSRLAGAFSVFGRYIWLTLWPHPLSADYSFDALGIGPGFVADRYSLVAAVACAGLGTVAWRLRRSNPPIAFGILLTVATYSIVSNTIVLIGAAMAERLFYLPSLGLCLAAGSLFDRALSRSATATAAVLLFAGAAAAWIGFERAQVWQSQISLFEATVATQPRSARAHMELAAAYRRAGRTQDALASYAESTAIKPDYAAAWYNLGVLYLREGRYDEALAAYQRATTHRPDFAGAWYATGVTQTRLGRFAAAVPALERAVSLSPRNRDMHVTLAQALVALGRYREAVTAYDAAIGVGDTSAGLLNNRGFAKQQALGCEAALSDYQAACSATIPDANACSNAESCRQTLGR